MQAMTKTKAAPKGGDSKTLRTQKSAKAPKPEPKAAVASATSDSAPEPTAGDQAAPASVPEATPTPEAAVLEPARKGKEKPKAKAAPEKPQAGTLQAVAEAYLRSLEDEGKSDSTVRSYRADLAIALGELGPETPVASITQAHVEKYFTCRKVTKTRAGKAKSEITKAKIRRTFRQALEFAEGAGLLPKSPVPEGTSH